MSQILDCSDAGDATNSQEPRPISPLRKIMGDIKQTKCAKIFKNQKWHTTWWFVFLQSEHKVTCLLVFLALNGGIRQTPGVWVELWGTEWLSTKPVINPLLIIYLCHQFKWLIVLIRYSIAWLLSVSCGSWEWGSWLRIRALRVSAQFCVCTQKKYLVMHLIRGKAMLRMF